METMVNERLSWWVEKRVILDDRQNGFRKGRGCNENLMELVTDVRNSLYENKRVMAVFFYITSAYDNVQRNILVKQLMKEKCPEMIIKFVNKWLGDRRTRFIIGEEISEERVIW